MKPTDPPAGEAGVPSQPQYTRDELMALDNFLTTHPNERRLLKYLFEHKDETHTLESLNANFSSRESGLPITFHDIKAMVTYKLMEASDPQGRTIRYPVDVREDSRFTVLPAKLDLIEAALQRRKWSAVKPGGSQ